MTIRPSFFLSGALALFSSQLVAETISFPVGQRQLFLDDHGIARCEGLKKTMHSPTKKGAVIRPDQPWEVWIQTRCAPAWNAERQVFQMWLAVCPLNPRYAGAAYAESADGIHWTKPHLRQRAYEGSNENNLLEVDPALRWPANYLESVLYTPGDPDPSRRYKGLLGAEGRQPVISADGLHWTHIHASKLSGSDEGNLSYDPLTRTYIATLKTFGKFGRAHAVWTSKDFVTWNRLSEIFQSDAEDQRRAKEIIRARMADPTLEHPTYNAPADYNADIYNLGLFRYEGLYVGMPAVYYATGKVGNNTDGFHWIQLACTRDLQTWQRLGDRQAFIGPSPIGQGAYDLTQLLPPSVPVMHGDEMWFYYTGLKYREPPANADPKWGAVCLAVLRRDGFISLDAGEKPGTLVTKPFVVTGAKLCVNVNAAGGSLGLEVLNDGEKPVAVARPITSDEPHAAVTWQLGDLAEQRGKSVRLRFTLQNAQLYSFWLEE